MFKRCSALRRLRDASWDARYSGVSLNGLISLPVLGILRRRMALGNFNIPCAVDGTTRIFLMPGLPIIALCWDGDTLNNLKSSKRKLYEAMLIQDFRGCSTVNIYPMHKVSAHFDFDDHRALRPVHLPLRGGKDISRLWREDL
ncbi:hypothetical protein Tco_0216273 [Tanacetum coccineum]